jgi:hypothetical protein
MSDEQRVRTMAGWVGVEISKSRVRTPGKAGYGLYRVRGYRVREDRRRGASGIGRSVQVAEPGEWTAYAFALGQIERAVSVAIQNGMPSRPADMVLALEDRDQTLVRVPTRWTSAYRGRRDLGMGEVEKAATAALGASLETDTPRRRQRAQNAEFQAEHLERRAYGLRARHAAKLARNRQPKDGQP